MKFLVLVLSLGVAVIARPDVSHLDGYHYKPPSTSYGVPVDNRYEPGHHHHQVTNVPTGSYLPGNLQVPNVQGHVNFLGGSSGNYAQKYDGYNPHLIQDQKHVYYYAAPDEEERPRLRIHIAPNNQKNTNVIFVKAPNYAPVVPEIISHPSQAEERTKVFVLVKKPEQPAPISIHAPTIHKSKPEVYVVKYHNQDEAERAISGGRGGHPIGVNVHHVNDEDSFVKTLHTDARLHLPQNDKYSGFDGNVDFFKLRGGFGNDDAQHGSTLLGSTNSGNSFEGSAGPFTGSFSSTKNGALTGDSLDSFNTGSHGGSSLSTTFGNKDGGVFSSGSQGNGGSSGTTFQISGVKDGGVFPSGSHGSGGSFEFSGVKNEGVFPSGSQSSGGSFEFSGVKDGGVFPSGSQSSGGSFEITGVKNEGVFPSGSQSSGGSFEITGVKDEGAFTSGSQGNVGSSGTTFEINGVKDAAVFPSGSHGSGGSFEISGVSKDQGVFPLGSRGQFSSGSGSTFEFSGNKGGDSFSSVSHGTGGPSSTHFEITDVTKGVEGVDSFSAGSHGHGGSTDGSGLASSLLKAVSDASHGSGHVDFVTVRHGGGADTVSGSSLLGTVSGNQKDESFHSKYGPPGASGPY